MLFPEKKEDASNLSSYFIHKIPKHLRHFHLDEIRFSPVTVTWLPFSSISPAEVGGWALAADLRGDEHACGVNGFERPQWKWMVLRGTSSCKKGHPDIELLP